MPEQNRGVLGQTRTPMRDFFTRCIYTGADEFYTLGRQQTLHDIKAGNDSALQIDGALHGVLASAPLMSAATAPALSQSPTRDSRDPLSLYHRPAFLAVAAAALSGARSDQRPGALIIIGNYPEVSLQNTPIFCLRLPHVQMRPAFPDSRLPGLLPRALKGARRSLISFDRSHGQTHVGPHA